MILVRHLMLGYFAGLVLALAIGMFVSLPPVVAVLMGGLFPVIGMYATTFPPRPAP